MDDALNIEDLLGEDIPLIEEAPLPAEVPTVNGGETVHEEDYGERQNSSTHTSSDSEDDDKEGEGGKEVPEASSSETLSSSA